jgi:hypothetical protein
MDEREILIIVKNAALHFKNIAFGFFLNHIES